MGIYNKLYKYLKKIYTNVQHNYEARVIEYDVITGKCKFIAYFFLSNIPFDIIYQGGECVYIDGHVLSDFRKIKKYINKKNKI